MAGHSKWHNIRFRKHAQDNKKSKIYHKYSNELRILARDGLDSPKLKSFIQLCKSKSIPNNIIKQALDCSEKNGEVFLYEITLGPYAFLAKAYTDNKNRTSSNIKALLNKYNAQLQKCTYLFKYTNIIKCTFNLDHIVDYIDDFCEHSIECSNKNFQTVIEKVSNIEDIFSGYVTVDSIQENETALELQELLENTQDIQQVYSNF